MFSTQLKNIARKIRFCRMLPASQARLKTGSALELRSKDFPFDIKQQSLKIPNGDGVRQSKLAPIGVTLEYAFEDTKTLVDVFHRGHQKSKNGQCLGWRDSNSDYRWLSYEEVIERSKNISYGLMNAGMKKGQESCLIIYSQNCVEYVLVEQACSLQSAIFVPLYDTFGQTAATFIINHVEAEFIVCDTLQKAKSIMDVKDSIPKLNHIVVIEDVDENLRTEARMKGMTIHQLKDIEQSGKQTPGSLQVPNPTDLAVICYTSGTTGNPKGVMLTHGNLVVAASAIIRQLGFDYIGKDDVHISYLPMAHVFDRIAQIVTYISGGSVGFFRGDFNLLMEDISALKPTLISAVPRILNKIYEKIQNTVESNKLKKVLFNMALRAKATELERGIIRNNSLWDRLILKNVRNIFGGKLRMLSIGAAPMSPEIQSFYKCSLGCPVIEYYGQTESAGGTNATLIPDYKTGTCGPPLPSAFIKLVDVPEMGYYARNGEGEILVKGPTIMKGYFKDPVKTAETIDKEGWLHTGDIGRWSENGAMILIDRKKNLMKLSHGEYISPEKIESVYLRSSFVEHIFVHGDPLQNFLVAIVSPDKESLMAWCSKIGLDGTWNDICRKEVVKTHILEDMAVIGNNAGLKGFERVKAIHLHPNGFSIQNGILTATMKVKREVCKRQFKEDIQKMYQEKKENQ